MMRDTRCWQARGQLLIVCVSLVLCSTPAIAATKSDFRAPCRRKVRTHSEEQLWGIADTHAHQFANLSIGGLVFWGAPFSDKGDFVSGMKYALPHCGPAHGAHGREDIVGNLLRAGIPGLAQGHGTAGFSSFDGWPAWDTRTHQQMYISWLKRAYEGGLRLMVMHAVNAEGLCSLSVIAKQLPCDDSSAIERQITGAKALEHYVDSLSGGPGRGWYRIVYTSSQARDAIRQGRLAVVLGIEVDNAFGCRAIKSCDSATVLNRLNHYYALGVRHIVPIHLSNNVLGGYALYHDYFDVNNEKNTGEFPETEPCNPGDSLSFRMQTPPVASLLLVWSVPRYPKRPHCNRVGLTPIGGYLLKEFMHRGMIIDVDHMSRKALTEAVELTSSNQYPVISGHTGFSQISLGQANHEGQKTRAQVQSIQRNGGMVSVIFVQGSTDEIAEWHDPSTEPVRNDCSNSSRTWAQAYLYAVTVEGGFDKAAVGMASDQVLNEWFGPRFGPDKHGCVGADTLRLKHGIYYVADATGKHPMNISRRRSDATQTDPVVYPVKLDSALAAHGVVADEFTFPKDVEGDHVFDFNTEGMAHIGLLPDFIRDLRNIGLSGNRLDPLFRSAGAYVALWERAERSAHAASTH